MAIVRVIAGLALGLSAGAGAWAQAWPSKPVRIVLGFPPGIAPDTVARMLVDKFRAQIGQSFVVENRPGAAGTIAGTQVAQSAPDGYTLMFAVAASMSVAPHFLQSAKYHPVTDFAPIGFIQRSPYYIAVRADVPINSFEELIAYGKTKPGVLNYGSPGLGTQHHLTWELMQWQTGARFTHIPLAGTPQIISEMLGGRLDAILDGAGGPFAAQVKAGKLKLVAMTGTQPLPIFPSIQPIGKTALPGFESFSWWGLVAPLGTPAAIIARMNAELNKALASADVIDRLTEEGAIISATPGSTPEEFGKWIGTEYERWGKVIKDAGIKLQ
ncbi:MAG: Bug family tripartite tricarboxylate transporter substrate binding protein [Burkholderiales bacterium]